MSALLEKLRRAREVRVPVGGYTFTVRRPTDVEWIELRDRPLVRAVLPFVVGWEGVKEIDLIPGGDPHPVPFNADVCTEWLIDRIDLLPEIVEAFVKAYEDHLAQRGTAEKN